MNEKKKSIHEGDIPILCLIHLPFVFQNETPAFSLTARTTNIIH